MFTKPIRAAMLGLTAAMCVPASASAARAMDVRVVNPPSEPVFVAVTGSPRVEVQSSAASPVVVRQAREPFQQYVRASTNTFTTACEAIEAPPGKRLVIESFTVFASGMSTPEVFLRTLVDVDGSVDSVPTLHVPLESQGGYHTGQITTLLHAGQANDASGARFSYEACYTPPNSSPNGVLQGLVSGWLE